MTAQTEYVDHILAEHGIAVPKPEPVALGDLELTLSGNHQVRAETDLDRVNEYALAMRDNGGAQLFPPIVVRRKPSGELIIIDGNHRGLAAEQADVNELQAQVITCSDEAHAVMSYLLNKGHGKPFEEQDKQMHAVTLALVHDYTPKQVAAIVGMSTKWVQATLKQDRLRKRLSQAGKAKASKGITMTLAEAVLSEPYPNVQLAIAELAVRHSLSSNDVRDIVRELAVTEGADEREAEALRVVKRIVRGRAESKKAAGRSRRKGKPQTNWMHLAKAVGLVLRKIDTEALAADILELEPARAAQELPRITEAVNILEDAYIAIHARASESTDGQ